MRRLSDKLNPKQDAAMQSHNQVGNNTANIKVKNILSYLNLLQQKLGHKIAMGMNIMDV